MTSTSTIKMINSPVTVTKNRSYSNISSCLTFFKHTVIDAKYQRLHIQANNLGTFDSTIAKAALSETDYQLIGLQVKLINEPITM